MAKTSPGPDNFSAGYNRRWVDTLSASSALGELANDLSRRIVLRHLYPFSFREYLLFTKDIEIPELTLNDIMVVEIGGKGKGREQFKGIKVEKKLILSHSPEVRGNKKPLSLLGFIV